MEKERRSGWGGNQKSKGGGRKVREKGELGGRGVGGQKRRGAIQNPSRSTPEEAG